MRKLAKVKLLHAPTYFEEVNRQPMWRKHLSNILIYNLT